MPSIKDLRFEGNYTGRRTLALQIDSQSEKTFSMGINCMSLLMSLVSKVTLQGMSAARRLCLVTKLRL